MNALLAAAIITCSTWQGIRTWTSADGYMSHESTWNGLTNGEDNQGNRWTGSTIPTYPPINTWQIAPK